MMVEVETIQVVIDSNNMRSIIRALLDEIKNAFLDAKIKISIFFPAPAWRLKSRRNEKRIATAVCKWRDESNEPN